MTGSGLRLDGITAGYGRSTVLRDVDLEVPSGSVVALLGSNGAGKTTLLRVAAGLIRPGKGRVTVGVHDVTSARPHARTRHGVCLIPEGRGIWRNLSVRDNLRLQVPAGQKDKDLAVALDAFPPLKARLNDQAGRLSGGMQQMLALSRAFLTRPKVALLDEVSMGLAPIVVEAIFGSLRVLADQGTALLVVEQYVNRALEMSDRVYMISHGSVVFNGAASELNEAEVVRHYLAHDFEHDVAES